MRAATVPPTVLYVQPTSEVGGADVSLVRLITQLGGAVRPVVVLPRPGPLTSRLVEAGACVRTVPMVQLRSLRSVRHQVRYLLHFWPTVLRLAWLARRERASLVHSNSMYSLQGAWAARLARIPHVWHVREIPDMPRPLLRLMAVMVHRLSSRVVAMTDAVLLALGRPPSRCQPVVTVPDGIDLDEFNPTRSGARIRAELGLNAEDALVGFVGRLDPWKGADVFVRIAAEVSRACPGAHFLVCGGALDGYEEHAEQLTQLAGELGLGARIHFTGWRFRLADIPEVMAALDVFVHTSVRPEPFGLVVVEAMATGRPVVAAAAGGVPEIVVDGTSGYLVRPGDVRAYARRVLALLDDPAAAAAVGRAARQRVEDRFDVRRYARDIESVYASVLQANGASR
jgi:glycosyltransferase involved in cell wall biosynthesis